MHASGSIYPKRNGHNVYPFSSSKQDTKSALRLYTVTAPTGHNLIQLRSTKQIAAKIVAGIEEAKAAQLASDKAAAKAKRDAAKAAKAATQASELDQA
jgi:hypothetical protein